MQTIGFGLALVSQKGIAQSEFWVNGFSWFLVIQQENQIVYLYTTW